MPWVVIDGVRKNVSDAEAKALVEQGSAELVEGQELGVKGAAGDVRSIGAGELEQAQRKGAEAASIDEIENAQLQERFGDSTLRAGAEGLLRGVTGPLGDAAIVALGGSKRGLRERRERNTSATIGEIGGAVGAGLLSGGGGLLGKALSLTPAGIVGNMGRAVGGVTGAALEGGLYGLGEGATQLQLSDEPITGERIASVLGSNTAFGLATGGAASILGKAAQKGLARARVALDEASTKLAATAEVGDDIARLDRQGLHAAKETERAAIQGERKAVAQTVPDDLAEYRRTVDESNVWMGIDDASKKRVLMKSKGSLRSMADEPIGLAERPTKLLEPLRKEAKVLREVIDSRESVLAKMAEEDREIAQKLADTLRYETGATVKLEGKLARRYGDFANVKIGRGGIDVPIDEAQNLISAIDAGNVQSVRAKALSNLDDLVAKNEALQQKILSTQGEVASPRLAQLDEAIATYAERTKPGFVNRLAQTGAQGVTTAVLSPVLGFFGATAVGEKVAGAVGSMLTGRLSKAAGELSSRIATGIDTFLSATERATKVAPVLATKTMQAIRYAPEDKKSAAAPPQRIRKERELVSAFRQREKEIRSQTAIGPSGRIELTRAAWDKMADQVRPIGAISPALGAHVETAMARRIEFLAEKLPKRPGAMRVGPDRWQPSDYDMAKFARYAAAVEDPAGIVERMSAWTMTPEDAEVLRVVYPEMFAQVQSEILAKLPNLRETLPYGKRLMLSLFSGVPVDPALQPETFAILQGNFGSEPESGGGMQAPVAQPQPHLSAMSNPQPTRAQRRAE